MRESTGLQGDKHTVQRNSGVAWRLRPKMWLSPLPAAGVQSPRTSQLQILLQRVPSLQEQPQAIRGISSDAVLGSWDCRACVGLPGGRGVARLCTALLRHPQLPGVCSTELGSSVRKACCLAMRGLAQMLGLGLNLAQPPLGEMLLVSIYPFPQHPRVSESTRLSRAFATSALLAAVLHRPVDGWKGD